MATQSPFSMFEGFLQSFDVPLAPPKWAVDETQRRLILLLNHILMQEPQAMERLQRQRGRTVLAKWREFGFPVTVTPAGLFDLGAPDAQPDLTFTVTQQSPLLLAQALMQGEKPPVHIEGDVQLAAEINWLVDHVRWDLEEDLSRLMGDVPAHTLMQNARAMADALVQFVSGRKPAGAAPGATA
jgi:ubiquinone biosynthesis accessory factor UbiJ